MADGHVPDGWAGFFAIVSEGCTRVGSRELRTGVAAFAGTDQGRTDTTGFQVSAGQARYGEDGTETVDAYDCEPDCPVRSLDEQSGPAGAQSRVGAGYASAPTDGIYGEMGRMASPHSFYADKGGASRFFYTSKADNAERWGYCETCDVAFNRKADGHLHPKTHKVIWHPTVKPVDLMQWLVRLVTPPGGLVLDPFAGTGTTGEAALLEGFRVALVEQDDVYTRIIRARLASAA